MKTNMTRNFLGSLALAFTLGLGTASITAHAAQPVKGGEKMAQLTEITTPAQAEALHPGDTIAMVCAKCKSVMVHNVTTEKGHIKVMTVGEKHLCPTCSGTIETKGVGKAAKDQVTHTCSNCGDNSVFCCATKPGSTPTPGMSK